MMRRGGVRVAVRTLTGLELSQSFLSRRLPALRFPNGRARTGREIARRHLIARPHRELYLGPHLRIGGRNRGHAGTEDRRVEFHGEFHARSSLLAAQLQAPLNRMAEAFRVVTGRCHGDRVPLTNLPYWRTSMKRSRHLIANTLRISRMAKLSVLNSRPPPDRRPTYRAMFPKASAMNPPSRCRSAREKYRPSLLLRQSTSSSVCAHSCAMR